MSRKIAILLAGIVSSIYLSCRYDSSDLSFFQVEFEGSTGWIAGRECFVSWDGGRSWNLSELSFGGNPEYHPLWVQSRIQFVNEKVGFHVLDGHLHKTIDSGATWLSVSSKIPIYYIYFVNERIGFGFTTPRRIHRTDDGGHSWRSTALPEMYGAVMVEGLIYSIVGRRLYSSDDLGSTWSVVREFPVALWGMKNNGQDLWLVGDKGACLKYDTRSGTIKDFSIPLEDDLHDSGVELHDIGIRNGKKIVVGNRPFIYVSDLDSQEWIGYPVAQAGGLAGVDFAPDGTAFVVGGRQTPVYNFYFTSPDRFAVMSKDYKIWKKVSLPIATNR